MESRSNPPVLGQKMSNPVVGKPETAPVPDDSSTKGNSSVVSVSKYIEATELSAAILSYAERSCPGVSSRINAADFVALSSGLIHASGLGSRTRKVNICPPVEYLDPIFRASREYKPVKNQVVGIAKKPTKEGKAKEKSKAPKPSNTNTGPTSKSDKLAKSKGRSATSDQKKSTPPLVGVAAARRTLKKSAVKSLDHLKREEKETDWSKEVGGIANMRCAVARSVTRDQVRAAIDKLSDEQVEKRDRSLPPLVFLGIIPRESIEGQLLIARAQTRQQSVAASASKVVKVEKKGESTTVASSTVAGTSVPASVPAPAKTYARAVSPPLSEAPGSRVATRAVFPAYPDDKSSFQERIDCVLRGIEMSRRNGLPTAPSGDDEDLFGEFLDKYKSSKPVWGRVTSDLTGSPFVSLTAKGQIVSFCVINLVGTARWAIVITNGAHPGSFSKIMQLPEFSSWRISRSCCNIFPVESPPRQPSSSATRRPSVSRPSVAPSVQERKASSDVVSDLYTLQGSGAK